MLEINHSTVKTSKHLFFKDDPNNRNNSATDYEYIEQGFYGTGNQFKFTANDSNTWRQLSAGDKVFALVRSGKNAITRYKEMSMGQIGAAVYKSHPFKFGQVKRICRDGLSLDYIETQTKDSGTFKMDILAPNHDLYLENLNFRVVSDLMVSGQLSFDLFKLKRLTVRFFDLTSYQKNYLDRLVKDTTGSDSSLRHNIATFPIFS